MVADVFAPVAEYASHELPGICEPSAMLEDSRRQVWHCIRVNHRAISFPMTVVQEKVQTLSNSDDSSTVSFGLFGSATSYVFSAHTDVRGLIVLLPSL